MTRLLICCFIFLWSVTPVWASGFAPVCPMSGILLFLLGIICLVAVLAIKRAPLLIIGALIYFVFLYLILERAWSCMFYLPILASLIFLGLFQELHSRKGKKLVVVIPLLLIALTWFLYFYCDYSNLRYQMEKERTGNITLMIERCTVPVITFLTGTGLLSSSTHPWRGSLSETP